MMRSCIRKSLVVLCVMVCWMWAACGPKYPITVMGEKGISEKAELDVQELVLRNLVGPSEAGEHIFVSFGDSWDAHVDPPAGFLERLTDVDAVFKPASDYAAHAGGNPLLLIVRVDRWITDTEARVSATRYRLGTGGAEGFTAEVRWSDGV